MGPPHVRSGRRLAFTAISFLLPVRLPLPPRFAALTTRRCFTTRTSIQRRLQLSLQQQCPGDNFITTAILAVASSTRSRCPGKVHPLLAGAAAESAALEEERPGGQEELGAATFDAVTSSPGSKLDAKDTGKDAIHTAAPSPIDEDSRSGIAPASLDCADRDRWQLRVRQASVAGLVGRVFRARSVPSGLVRNVSRAAQSSTAEATFHNKEMTNLEVRCKTSNDSCHVPQQQRQATNMIVRGWSSMCSPHTRCPVYITYSNIALLVEASKTWSYAALWEEKGGNSTFV